MLDKASSGEQDETIQTTISPTFTLLLAVHSHS